VAAHTAYKTGEEHHPAGRLVPVFAASDITGQSDLALKLGRHAASFGETVLMLDCNNGEMMKAAGVIYNKTIHDALNGDADLRDVKYITSNEPPAHVRLASAADVSLLAYDTRADKFMRAYWMIEAVRHRDPKFDPVVLSMGERADAVETALMLTDTVREHLGAPPPYAGHAEDGPVAERLIKRMRDLAERAKVA